MAQDLTKKHFDIFDGGLACLLFVTIQFLYLKLLPIAIYSNSVLYVIASVLLEGIFVLAAVIVIFARKRNFVQSTTLNAKINWQIVLLCFGVAFAGIILFSQSSNAFAYTLELFGYTSVSGGISVANAFEYALHIVVTCAVPAFCEEFLFRGVVLNSFRNTNKWLGIFASAFFFMLMHGNPDQTIHQFLIGFVLSYVAWETNNIWVPILIHFFNNFIAITLTFVLTMSTSGAETPPEDVAPITANQVVYLWLIGIIMAGVGVWLVLWLTKYIKQQSEKANAKEPASEQTEQEKLAEQPQEQSESQVLPQEENQKSSRATLTLTILSYVAFSAYCLYEWVALFLRGIGG